MEVTRLGIKSELQLPAYTTGKAMWDPSYICDLHHSSWQRQIFDPLSKARDQTCVLMDTRQVPFCYITVGTPEGFFFKASKFLVIYAFQMNSFFHANVN